jgi:cysteine desulfurase/selenocysteine lyase
MKPKLVSFMHMSNVLGTINPASEIVERAKSTGAITLIDAAQSVPHMKVDVQELDVDFLAFSSHKMCGPTGLGVLYGKQQLLDDMPPFLGGGDMIKRVHLNSFTANELPYKFEAGTPPIAEVIGLGAAIDYLTTIGMDNIFAHERELIEYALDRLVEVPGVDILGLEGQERGAVASMTIQGIHPHDISQVLDSDGIAIRAGHHCAMPLHERFNLPATARASFYLYNSRSDIDSLVDSLYAVIELFGIH